MVKNRSAPPGPVVPCLVYADVREAIEWLCDVFGFEQHHRWEHDGVIQGAQVLVGEGSVFLRRQRDGEVPPKRGEPMSHSVMVDCSDADAQYERIRSKGGTVYGEPTTYPFGERQFSAEDLAGHHWTFSESVADVAAEDWGGISEPLQMPTQISPMLAVSDAREMIEFYKRVFGAVENWRIDGGEHVVCGMSIDGAEFFLASESPPGTQSPRDVGGVTCRIELFVDDPEAVYDRAVAAGATAGERPKLREHATGDGGTFRMIQGGITDPSGHTWLIGKFLG